MALLLPLPSNIIFKLTLFLGFGSTDRVKPLIFFLALSCNTPHLMEYPLSEVSEQNRPRQSAILATLYSKITLLVDAGKVLPYLFLQGAAMRSDFAHYRASR